MIATDLNKQEGLDADTKAIHQSSFTRNLEPNENTAMFFITEEVKETILDFSQTTVKVF